MARVVKVTSDISLCYQCRLRVSESIDVVGFNAEHIPASLATLDFPPGVSPGTRSDGSWGPHEYTLSPQLFCPDSPYMGWIPVSYVGVTLPHYISTFVFDPGPNASHFRVHKAWPTRGTVNPEILDVFQREINDLYVLVSEAFKGAQARSITDAVRLPVRAVERTYASLLALRVNFLTRRDVSEYMACLKRSIAELHGFLLWALQVGVWVDRTGTAQTAVYAKRGVVCEETKVYDDIRKMGVPAWCFVEGLPRDVLGSSVVAVPSSYGNWSGVVLHNKALFFYPPVVADSRQFELAARGYAARLDKLHRDKGYRKDLGDMEAVYDRMSNDRDRVAQGVDVEDGEICETHGSDDSLRPSYAISRAIGIATYNLNFSALMEDLDLNPRQTRGKIKEGSSRSSVGWERLWIESRTNVPNWVLPYHPTWDTDVQSTSHGPVFGSRTLQPSERVHMMHVLPLPSYFFHVRSEDKLRTYFYIWTTIRRFVIARHIQSGLASFDVALTAQSWRDVLSGMYFKKRNTWKGKSFDDSVDKPFHVDTFWEFGGPLVFGADESEEDKTPLCEDGEKLKPSDFDSPRLRAFLLWDLSILHCQVQLDRADVLLFDACFLDPRSVTNRTNLRCKLFRPVGTDLSTYGPWDDIRPTIRKSWFSGFQCILSGWPMFKEIMGQIAFIDARDSDGPRDDGTIDLDQLTERDYDKVEKALIFVYYCGVADTFGRMPVVPFKKPTYTGDIKRYFSI